MEREIIRRKLLEDVAKHRLKVQLKASKEAKSELPTGYRKCVENEHYAVSSAGDVLNLKTGKALYPKLSKDGYPRVTIYADGKPRAFYVHR